MVNHRSESVEGQLFAAARDGDCVKLGALLNTHPDKLNARNQPYEHTLLHVAAQNGHLDAVDLLIDRGLDPNTREKGDNTYPMHWAAGAGHLDVVRRLADAGGDVIGDGDDHALQVIGWATSRQPRGTTSHLLGDGSQRCGGNPSHRCRRSIPAETAAKPQ